MKIQLKTIEINSFKGIKDLKINFGQTTNIYGDNGQGKTTIFDAFCWCLFGKNAKSEAKFNIKPLNADGTEKQGIESIVKVLIEKDGIETTFSRSYHEVWKTPRGRAEKIFEGHKTDYLVNEGNVSQKEYQNRVNDLIDERIFKMITDVYAFTSLKDKEQREILFKVLGGDIEEKDIIAANGELKPLESLLNGTKIEFLMNETKGKIKKNKEEKEKIPARIDELENMKKEIDPEEIEKEKEEVNNHLAIVTTDIEGIMRMNTKIEDKKNELLAKKHKYLEKYNKAKNEIETNYINAKYEEMELKKNEYNKLYETLKSEIDKKYDNTKVFEEIRKIDFKNREKLEDLYTQKGIRDRLESDIRTIDRVIEGIELEYLAAEVEEFKFDETNLICNSCKRPLGNTEELKASKHAEFIETQARKMMDLTKSKDRYLADKWVKVGALEETNLEILMLESDLSILSKSQEELKSFIKEKPPIENEKLTSLKIEIDKLSTEIRNIPTLEIDFEGMTELKHEINILKTFLESSSETDTKPFLLEMKAIEDKLRALDKDLMIIENNKEIDNRISELMERERDLSNKKAELEGILYLLDTFAITKTNLITKKINEKFKTISFKLFETYYGSEGIKEVCEATIEGVPFSNANTASRINAGLEIINVLSDFYNVKAPIFIDSAESVTKLYNVDSQLITLNVVDLMNENGYLDRDKTDAFDALHYSAKLINNLYVEVL